MCAFTQLRRTLYCSPERTYVPSTDCRKEKKHAAPRKRVNYSIGGRTVAIHTEKEKRLLRAKEKD